MYSIETPKGKYRFKFKPLYPGVKRIDKVISKKNLIFLKEFLDSHNIPFLLSYGTLLGAVREHDFIDHDEDIDLIIKDNYRDMFLSALFELRTHGFELVRYDRRDLYSLMKDGEYIDFYFFKQIEDGNWYCSGVLIPDEFMGVPDTIVFMNHSFQTHSNHLKMLEFEYGVNWRIPVIIFNYQLPYYKRLIFNLKEIVRYNLPESLLKQLTKKAESIMIERYLKKIEDYRKNQRKP